MILILLNLQIRFSKIASSYFCVLNFLETGSFFDYLIELYSSSFLTSKLYRIFIFEDIISLSKHTQIKLCELIEKYSANTLNLLICNSIEYVIPNIISRCTIYNFMTFKTFSSYTFYSHVFPLYITHLTKKTKMSRFNYHNYLNCLDENAVNTFLTNEHNLDYYNRDICQIFSHKKFQVLENYFFGFCNQFAFKYFFISNSF